MAEHESLELDPAAIAARAAGAESAVFLDGYIEMLVAVSATGRRLTGEEHPARPRGGGRRAELLSARAGRSVSQRELADLARVARRWRGR